jgi:hypothetical protein
LQNWVIAQKEPDIEGFCFRSSNNWLSLSLINIII